MRPWAGTVLKAAQAEDVISFQKHTFHFRTKLCELSHSKLHYLVHTCQAKSSFNMMNEQLETIDCLYEQLLLLTFISTVLSSPWQTHSGACTFLNLPTFLRATCKWRHRNISAASSKFHIIPAARFANLRHYMWDARHSYIRDTATSWAQLADVLDLFSSCCICRKRDPLFLISTLYSYSPWKCAASISMTFRVNRRYLHSIVWTGSCLGRLVACKAKQ